jgi:predicted Rossmann-fold nucleotide-binding protein
MAPCLALRQWNSSPRALGQQFWEGMRRWGQFMMKEGMFARDEMGFGHITDSRKEAVDLIVCGLPPALRARPKPA